MLRARILTYLAFSIVTLCIMNMLATFFSWYTLLWWFDMPMHFLGGIAVFYIGAIIWLPALRIVPFWRFLYEGIITAILLGVLWEALELYLHIRYGNPGFILLDSLSDMGFDTAGALFAAFLTVSFSNLAPQHTKSQARVVS